MRDPEGGEQRFGAHQLRREVERWQRRPGGEEQRWRRLEHAGSVMEARS
jgi:hypothetical protein